MSYFNKEKLPFILVGLLTALNLCLLAVIWLGSAATEVDKPVEDRKGRLSPGGNFLVEALKFEEAQVEALEKLRENHFEERKRRGKEMRKIKDNFFGNLKKAEVDSAEIETLIAQITEIVAANEASTFWHLRNVRALCTDAQAEKFGEVIGEMLRREGRRIHGPGGHGGVQGPPPLPPSRRQGREGRGDGPPPHPPQR
ncbi:MAG: hypothetical protein AAF570_08645 [Bacteroidota bacterium]